MKPFLSTDAYEMGLAIGSCNIVTGDWEFRFRDELFSPAALCLSEIGERPMRFVRIFKTPEIRCAMVAKVEELRKANELAARKVSH